MTSPHPDNSKNKIIPAERSNSTRLRRLSSCRLSRLIFLLLSTSTLFFSPLNAAAQETTRRVLILTGSDPIYPGSWLLTRTVGSTLRVGSDFRFGLLYKLHKGCQDSPDYR